MKKGYVISSDGRVLGKFEYPDTFPDPVLRAGETVVWDRDLTKEDVGDQVAVDEAGKISSVITPPAETAAERVSRIEQAIDAGLVDRAMLKKLVREIVLGEKVLK
jgi:hypothetical protein